MFGGSCTAIFPMMLSTSLHNYQSQFGSWAEIEPPTSWVRDLLYVGKYSIMLRSVMEYFPTKANKKKILFFSLWRVTWTLGQNSTVSSSQRASSWRIATLAVGFLVDLCAEIVSGTLVEVYTLWLYQTTANNVHKMRIDVCANSNPSLRFSYPIFFTSV